MLVETTICSQSLLSVFVQNTTIVNNIAISINNLRNIFSANIYHADLDYIFFVMDFINANHELS